MRTHFLVERIAVERRYFKTLCTCAQALALLAASIAHAATIKPTFSPTPPNPDDTSDPRNGNSLPDDGIGIVNLNDEDFSLQLRNCLTHKTLAHCLAQEVGSNTSDQKTRPVTDEIASSVDEGLVAGLRTALQNMISYGQTVFQNKTSLYVSLGFQVGGNRIDMDEIATDPNKLATEQKLSAEGKPGVWVKHEFELYPGTGYGITAGSLGQPNGSNGFYGAGFNANLWMRITKRHPMDSVYNSDFWGFTRQDTKIMGQAFPMYFTIGEHINGDGLLPGEGIELERYGVIQVAVGPNFTLLPAPVPTWITAGLAASAGVSGSFIVGHFRTTMEAQADGTLRVTLMRLNQQSAKLMAQLNAGLLMGPINYVYNLVDLEAGIIHSSETLLDMVVDPKYPPALKALHHAYLGSFAAMQQMASQAQSNYEGVRNFADTKVSQVTHERDFKFFTFEKGSSTSEANVDTKFYDDDSESDVTLDTMTGHRSTLKSSNDLLLYISTDDSNPDPLSNRSMSLKYKFSSKDAKPDEVREFLDLARLLAPADQQAQVSALLESLNSDHPGKKRGRFTGYFYVSFDPTTLSSLLGIPNEQKQATMMASWAKALGLSDPDSWGKMSTEEQDQAAAQVPGLTEHLTRLRKFMRAVFNALQNKDAIGQARTVVSALRSEDFDLYPIAALAVPADPSHLMALERMTLEKENKTLEYAAIGANFIFPKRTAQE